ncbi:MAG: hypothetical protein MZU79_06515 [Anaerotruncus sp.]|nr:hypothetical protein [Anaerotruncus sp.]
MHGVLLTWTVGGLVGFVGYRQMVDAVQREAVARVEDAVRVGQRVLTNEFASFDLDGSVPPEVRRWKLTIRETEPAGPIATALPRGPGKGPGRGVRACFRTGSRWSSCAAPATAASGPRRMSLGDENKLPDLIRDIVFGPDATAEGAGTITLFEGDVRIATNVTLPDGRAGRGHPRRPRRGPPGSRGRRRLERPGLRRRPLEDQLLPAHPRRGRRRDRDALRGSGRGPVRRRAGAQHSALRPFHSRAHARGFRRRVDRGAASGAAPDSPDVGRHGTGPGGTRAHRARAGGPGGDPRAGGLVQPHERRDPRPDGRPRGKPAARRDGAGGLHGDPRIRRARAEEPDRGRADPARPDRGRRRRKGPGGVRRGPWRRCAARSTTVARSRRASPS